MKQVPMSDIEIQIVIRLLSHAIPAQDEQETVFNLINRLKVVARS